MYVSDHIFLPEISGKYQADGHVVTKVNHAVSDQFGGYEEVLGIVHMYFAERHGVETTRNKARHFRLGTRATGTRPFRVRSRFVEAGCPRQSFLPIIFVNTCEHF